MISAIANETHNIINCIPGIHACESFAAGYQKLAATHAFDHDTWAYAMGSVQATHRFLVDLAEEIFDGSPASAAIFSSILVAGYYSTMALGALAVTAVVAMLLSWYATGTKDNAVWRAGTRFFTEISWNLVQSLRVWNYYLHPIKTVRTIMFGNR